MNRRNASPIPPSLQVPATSGLAPDQLLDLLADEDPAG
jgi:hypothetical protein